MEDENFLKAAKICIENRVNPNNKNVTPILSFIEEINNTGR